MPPSRRASSANASRTESADRRDLVGVADVQVRYCDAGAAPGQHGHNASAQPAFPARTGHHRVLACQVTHHGTVPLVGGFDHQ
jgi:hypothetical protein